MRGPLRSLLTLTLLAGCVFGARGERTFADDFGLTDVETIRVSLPSTPLPVTACNAGALDCERLEVSGLWLTVAGTKSDAKKYTQEARLDFQVDDGFGLLTAVKPLKVQDLIDLEVEDIRVPDDRDLELATGVGDVTVLGTNGAVSVENYVGDVRIENGDGAVVVRTVEGGANVRSSGIADIYTRRGGVELVQEGSARDAYVYTDSGHVVVELASDANLDLHIQATGRIEVKTDTINTVTSGSFWREVGNGTNRVEIGTGFGSVTVSLYDGT